MPRTIGDIRLYSVDELNKKLNISKVTLRNYFKQGKIKGVKMGNRWFVSEDSLKDFFAGANQG